MRTLFAFTILFSFAIYGLSIAYGTRPMHACSDPSIWPAMGGHFTECDPRR